MLAIINFGVPKNMPSHRTKVTFQNIFWECLFLSFYYARRQFQKKTLNLISFMAGFWSFGVLD